jgi:hypothetical protein
MIPRGCGKELDILPNLKRGWEDVRWETKPRVEERVQFRVTGGERDDHGMDERGPVSSQHVSDTAAGTAAAWSFAVVSSRSRRQARVEITASPGDAVTATPPLDTGDALETVIFAPPIDPSRSLALGPVCPASLPSPGACPVRASAPLGMFIAMLATWHHVCLHRPCEPLWR